MYVNIKTNNLTICMVITQIFIFILQIKVTVTQIYASFYLILMQDDVYISQFSAVGD